MENSRKISKTSMCTDKANTANYEKALLILEDELRSVKKSREFLLGAKILRWKQRFCHLDIKFILKRIKTLYQLKKNKSLYFDTEPSKEEINRTVPTVGCSCDTDITIYSCIVGGYDKPKTPLIEYSNCLYVLYTDDTSISAPGWQIKPIPEKLKKLKVNEINRYMKFHPEEVCNTRYGIYVDGNVKLICGIPKFIEKVSEKTGLAIFMHPWRDCIYTEARMCQLIGKGNAEKLQLQVDAYQKEGFPKHYGQPETSVIVSDLNNPLSTELLRKWYEEHTLRGGGRDQISLPYILWKNKLTVSDIGSLGEDIDQSLYVRRERHSSK